MPTESGPTKSGVTCKRNGWELTDVHTLRLAIGSTLAVVIAFGVAWPVSFLTPVLVWNFLRSSSAGFSLAAGLDVIRSLVVGCLTGVVYSLTLLRYPTLFLLVMWLLLFLIFYANTGGISPNLFLWMMVGVLVVPLLGLQSLGLSLPIVGYLMAGGITAVVLTWLAQVLIPDSLASHQASSPVGQPAPIQAKMSSPRRVRSACLSTVVVGPLATLVYTFNLTDELLMMVFVAMMAQAASSAAGAKASAAMLIGNVLGWVAAIVFYHLLLAAPTYGFLIMLTFLGSLVFARANFSSGKMAPFYGMAFSNLLLLIGQSTAPGGDTAGLKFVVRVVQVLLAAVYLILAFKMAERFQKKPSRDGEAAVSQPVVSGPTP
jgi:hypothetical protein